MADIRINALATTASSTASDDFLAVDGSANGTRKLNAYSPTFGGNLTVSGKIIGGNSSDSGAISTLRSSGAATGLANVKASSALTVVDNTTANTDSAMVFGVNGSGAYIQGLYTTVASTITLQPYGGATTLGGNLTVSGTGTSSVAGTLNVSGGFILNRINAKGIYTGTSDNCGFTWTGTNGEFSTDSGSLILKSAGTTALTLDSSQNATFAGTIKPQQAATASAPSYVKGAIYFDTTLNKLRVGGAIGWETITSV